MSLHPINHITSHTPQDNTHMKDTKYEQQEKFWRSKLMEAVEEINIVKSVMGKEIERLRELVFELRKEIESEKGNTYLDQWMPSEESSKKVC